MMCGLVAGKRALLSMPGSRSYFKLIGQCLVFLGEGVGFLGCGCQAQGRSKILTFL